MSSKYAPFGGATYNLQSSIGSTDTSFTLSSFLEPVTGTPYTMALINSDIAYGTIAPKTTSSEFISFTGITQNADGTALLTGVTRGLAKKSPFASDSAYKLPHSGQTQFIISDAPQVFNEYVTLHNAETIDGLKTFPGGGNASAPVSGTVYSAPTNQLEYASKGYVDATATGSAVTNQLLVSGTAGASVVAGTVGYKKVADGKWYTALANDTSTFQQLELGIFQASVSTNASVNMLLRGLDSNQTGLTAGVQYFLTDVGGISATPGTNTVFLGYGQSATSIIFDPRSPYDIPYHAEKLAFVGTSGTPSTTNKFETENDTSNGATQTSTTISFTASTKTIADSGSGFVTSNFRAGDSVVVSGTASNNGTYTMVSVAAGAIVVAETLVNESAGASMTLATAVNNKLIRATSAGVLPSGFSNVLNYQVFTGSGTWTKPASGVNDFVFIQAWGAGGGGGGSVTGGTSRQGAGGGGGAYAEAKFRLSDLLATETVTIGAGGVGNSAAAGSVGGNTTFGAHLTAFGGGGGGQGNSSVGGGAGGAGVTSVGNSGGVGTAGAGGSLLGGASGSSGSDSTFGGGGGATAGNGAGGNSYYGGGGGGSNGGVGGNSIYGGGGGGAGSAGAGGLGSLYGGTGGAGFNGATGVGNPGVAPAGGGGGSTDNGTANRAGGAGARGEVRVWVIGG